MIVLVRGIRRMKNRFVRFVGPGISTMNRSFTGFSIELNKCLDAWESRFQYVYMRLDEFYG